MTALEIPQSKTSFEQCLKDFELRVPNKQMTAMVMLASLGLSACGGGGTATQSSSVVTDTGGGSVTTGTSTDDSSSGTVSDGGAVGGGAAGGGAAGGGGAGGGAASDILTLSRSGSNYSTSSISGFSLQGTDSHYLVADAADDSYDITLTANGSGMLTFEFSDAADTVTLQSGSTVSGFSQLKVIRGTVDVSNTDLYDITYISVASGIKLSTAQILNLDAIIINSESGSVEVLVQSQDEINQISSALSSGAINLYSPADDLMTLAAAPGSTVSAGQISTGQSNLNAEKQAISAFDEVATIVITGSTNGLSGSELSGNVSVTVFPDAGSTVISGRIDGVDVGNITNNAFTFSGASMTGGFHTVSVITQNASGIQTVTQEEFLVVGSSNAGSDMFEFKTNTVGDLVTVEMYVKNLHSDLSDGIRSYDFWIDLDETKFDYVEGSFTPYAGSINAGLENQTNGEIFANGFFTSPWKIYDSPLFTFQANSLSSEKTLEIDFVDLTIYRTDFGDFTAVVDI